MRVALLIGVFAAGCAHPSPEVRDVERTWVLGEVGDGRVLAFCRVTPERVAKRLQPIVELPTDVAVGEEFVVTIRLPGAVPGDHHHVRIAPSRPGLRLLGSLVVDVVGPGPATCAAVADSAGVAAFSAVLEP